MSFGQAIASAFSKYFTFSGRARRSEYWFFYLFTIMINVPLSILSLAVPELVILGNIVSIGLFFPSLCVTVRRFHDIGKSGWNILLFTVLPIVVYAVATIISIAIGTPLLIFFAAIFLIAMIVVYIIWMCRDSEPGYNKWGPNPKGIGNEPYETEITEDLPNIKME